MRVLPIAALLAALLVLPACGDDDDEPVIRPLPTTTEPAPPPTAAAPEDEEEPAREVPGERRERTPDSLAECVREADGVSEVLVKGRDSEDARFFAGLVSGRVDVLGVTLSGESAEVTLVLFASEADAAKAAPQAGGGGVVARPRGAAVVVAPPGARVDGVEACLRATGYA